MAGHDTSATTLTWFFWELAKHPESAQEIREEIAAVRARIGARDFSISDLEGMSTMLAALKVKTFVSALLTVLVLNQTCRSQCGFIRSSGSFREVLRKMMLSRWHSQSRPGRASKCPRYPYLRAHMWTYPFVRTDGESSVHEVRYSLVAEEYS